MGNVGSFTLAALELKSGPTLGVYSQVGLSGFSIHSGPELLN
jgi:hypothetical protein